MKPTNHLSNLAAEMTQSASKQTYYTIRLLADRDRIADAYRAYAYFRWVDDVLDAESGARVDHSLPDAASATAWMYKPTAEIEARRAFLHRQETLLQQAYRGEPLRGLCPEEELLAGLVHHDCEPNSGLQCYLRNMMAVMAFDVARRGRLISQIELNTYTRWLAVAVTEALHYFIGHDAASPHTAARYMAVSAAHITHLLRDAVEDTQAGYFNIPCEALACDQSVPLDVRSHLYRAWVRQRVALARTYFKHGKAYLTQVENPRCRLAGFAYIARFEWLLNKIEQEGFCLRAQYDDRKSLESGLQIGWLAASSMLDVRDIRRRGAASLRPYDLKGKNAMETKSVIVIGAGIGGMVAATHLAQQGVKVTVIEKNSHAGGRCDRISRDGHHFDTGPTLLVMPLLYEDEFRALGTSMAERLDLLRVDPTYHLVFDDGRQLALTSDMQSMQQQLETFENGSFDGFLRYMNEGHRHYTVGVEKLVRRDFRKAADFFAPGNLPLLYQVKPFVNHYANMAAYFDDPRLKAAFSFQDVYMGLSPFEAPATFSLMPYSELAHGVYYPRGGMYSIVEALMGMAREAGVEFIFDTAVEKIDVKAQRTRGVTLPDGQFLAADAVLANADLPYVYESLLPDKDAAATMAHKRFSCSVISFFWGLDKSYETLAPHTLFLVDDYRQNFTSIIDDLDLPENASLYIHAPARLDPAMAPPGQDTLIAIVPVGHLSENGAQDWGTLRDAARQQVFRRLAALGINDLEEHIKFETTFTPLSWRKRYNLMKGSTHGLCHNIMQLGYMRPHNRHDRYHNLYFTGASTHPGTGMPTAMVSGRLSAQRILDDFAA